ncbi:MAG: alpha/beta hydrolase [Chloroflexi bacterium]|nr:alpha/beta hydrolase [Chloroflexota bacterium]
MNLDPHRGQVILSAGEPLEHAHAAMVLIHGRGGTARSILALSRQLHQAGFAFLAPQAEGNSWYPNRFMTPIDKNEPWLSSALLTTRRVLQQLAERGIYAEQAILLGFSQGACLALEYVARNARRYGGVVALSGGLIGPDGTPRDYAGSLAGTPIFIGCSDVDAHIPKQRVLESAEVMRRLSADVTARLYPNMNHTINQDEIDTVRAMMAQLVQRSQPS